MADDWISQSEAAQLRGVSVSAITHLVRRGRLTRTKDQYGMVFVSRSEVQAFEPSPGGWPKGKPRGTEKRGRGVASACEGRSKGKKRDKG
jgi:hypothetical protein